MDPSIEARLDSLEVLVQRWLGRLESIEQSVGARPPARRQEPAAGAADAARRPTPSPRAQRHDWVVEAALAFAAAVIGVGGILALRQRA